jgi:hypothetical protein
VRRSSVIYRGNKKRYLSRRHEIEISLEQLAVFTEAT